MLRIYPITLDVCAGCASVAGVIARKDPDLARQLRRAVTSIALTPPKARARSRPTRYYTALGSARETLACIDVAVAMRLIRAPEPAVFDRLHRVIATLVRLTRS